MGLPAGPCVVYNLKIYKHSHTPGCRANQTQPLCLLYPPCIPCSNSPPPPSLSPLQFPAWPLCFYFIGWADRSSGATCLGLSELPVWDVYRASFRVGAMVLEKPKSIPCQCDVTARISGKGWEGGLGHGREQSLAEAPPIAQHLVG